MVIAWQPMTTFMYMVPNNNYHLYGNCMATNDNIHVHGTQ